MFTTTPSLIQQLRTWRDVSRQPERQTPASKEEVLTTDHKRYIFIPAATTRKNVFRPCPVEWLDCNHDICIRKVTCWFFYRKLKPVWRNFFQLPIYSWSQRGPGSPLGMCEVTKNKLFVCRPISHWNPPPKIVPLENLQKPNKFDRSKILWKNKFARRRIFSANSQMRHVGKIRFLYFTCRVSFIRSSSHWQRIRRLMQIF